MSYSKQFYLGPFLKVMNPDKYTTELQIVRGCINSDCFDYKVNTQPKNYCSVCGSEIKEFEKQITKSERLDLYTTCKELFNNGDMFTGHIPRFNGVQVIIPNTNKILSYNEDDFDDGEIFSFTRTSIFNFDNEEWKILIDELLSQGFQVEKDIGIIHYEY